MNSKQKGDLCVSKAIAYYVEAGYEILLPLGDRRPYDLVIENSEGKLLKVQCKFTSYKSKHGIFTASLKVCGGNRSSGNRIKKYQKTDFDILFVLTSEGSMYSVPYSDIDVTNSFNLGKQTEIWKVN